jgi:purine nucleosidase
VRIWIDTDLGTDVDDALTLALALRHPQIELVGVSTVFGDVELRARMADRLLAVGGLESCPVCVGLGKPLTPDRLGVMAGHEGKGLLEQAEPQRRVESDPHAERRIAELAETLEQARPDALVAIGPLTNVGSLLKVGARLPRLAIMGGKTTSEPIEDVNPAIEEWNWFCDPQAVDLVLSAVPPEVGPIRVVPAEVTFRTELIEGDLEQLAAGDPLCRALERLSRIWLETQAQFGFPRPRVALHDPLTLATLVVEDLCPTEPMRLSISADGKTRRDPGEANVEVAVDVDPERMRRLLMTTLLPD